MFNVKQQSVIVLAMFKNSRYLNNLLILASDKKLAKSFFNKNFKIVQLIDDSRNMGANCRDGQFNYGQFTQLRELIGFHFFHFSIGSETLNCESVKQRHRAQLKDVDGQNAEVKI